MKSCAVAVFVKTPGLSPVKTRLSDAIGRESAEEFHLASARAIESVIAEACRSFAGGAGSLKPYWAVAEEEALTHPAWSGFETVLQGSGDLGMRLDHVYRELRARHDAVIFLGADSPQLSPMILIEAAGKLLLGGDFVLGRAMDGGYYLFGGTRELSTVLWTSVPYSTSMTARIFAAKLEELGVVEELPELLDVDTIEELKLLSAELASRDDLLPAQSKLGRLLMKLVVIK